MLTFRQMRLRALPLVIGVALATVVVAAGALADAPAVEARAAYERGSAAFAAHDHALAAREFARADAILPSDAAIEAALEASLRAGDPVLGMELVDRARGRALDARAERAASRVAAAFSARVGRVRLACEGATACSGTIDGVDVARPRAPVVVAPGRHSVRVVRDGQTRDVAIDVRAEATVDVALDDRGAPTAPAPAPSAAPSPTSRVPTSPPLSENAPPATGRGTTTVVALVGGGVTLALGAVTAVSFVDLRARRKDFENGACAVSASATTRPAADCNARADRGRTAELRTDLLGVGTGVALAATVALVLWRPWERSVLTDDATKLRVGVAPLAGGGALLGAGGTFR